jgi:hypothetical protein
MLPTEFTGFAVGIFTVAPVTFTVDPSFARVVGTVTFLPVTVGTESGPSDARADAPAGIVHSVHPSTSASANVFVFRTAAIAPPARR